MDCPAFSRAASPKKLERFEIHTYRSPRNTNAWMAVDQRPIKSFVFSASPGNRLIRPRLERIRLQEYKAEGSARPKGGVSISTLTVLDLRQAALPQTKLHLETNNCSLTIRCQVTVPPPGDLSLARSRQIRFSLSERAAVPLQSAPIGFAVAARLCPDQRPAGEVTAHR